MRMNIDPIVSTINLQSAEVPGAPRMRIGYLPIGLPEELGAVMMGPGLKQGFDRLSSPRGDFCGHNSFRHRPWTFLELTYHGETSNDNILPGRTRSVLLSSAGS